MDRSIKKAFIESVADTALAAPINIVLNYFILLIAFQYNWGAMITTCVVTFILTIVAITRKVYVRLKFEKIYGSQ